MSASTNILSVSLGDVEVGQLELSSGGLDRTRFTTSETYRSMPTRPVLSRALEDDLTQFWESRVRAPAFFSNLLPEGVLRRLLAERAGVNPAREFFLLAALGEDLPGNVFVRPLGQLSFDEGPIANELPAPGHVDNDEALRFSVAGLQLKVPANLDRMRWVLPVRGSGGRWLLKLPSPRFPAVPRNEFWTMKFAHYLGLSIAEVQLVSLEEVGGLREIIAETQTGAETEGLLVRRFDRTPTSLRIHTEDLMQVLNKHPDDKQKYRAANSEWVGRLLRALDTSGTDLKEFVRRLVFNALIGNGDAHLKNWMLRYEDPRVARLSPGYDLVSTIQYGDTDQEEFALKLADNKRYDRLDIEHFARFAKKLVVPGQDDVDPTELQQFARDFARKLVDSWSAFARTESVASEFTVKLEKHWQRIPLVNRP